MMTERNYQPELDSIHREIRDMKSLMSTMVETMGRITIIEERQHGYASTAEKLLDRLDEVVRAQHQSELASAVNSDVGARVKVLEAYVRDTHVETESAKARLDTIITGIKILWAVVSVFGLTGIGYIFTRAGNVLPVVGFN